MSDFRRVPKNGRKSRLLTEAVEAVWTLAFVAICLIAFLELVS